MSAAASAAAAAAASSQSHPEADPGPGPANAVPPAAVPWIVSQLLASGGRAAADRAAHVPARGLGALQVRDLRFLCATLQSLVDDALSASTRPPPTTASGPRQRRQRQLDDAAAAYARFVRPKSGAKKAVWMAAIRRCFYTDDGCAAAAPPGDPIWALLGVLRSNTTSTAAASRAPAAATATAAAAAAASVPAPAAAAPAYPYGMPYMQYQQQYQQPYAGYGGGFAQPYAGYGGASFPPGAPFAAAAAASTAYAAAAAVAAAASSGAGAQQRAGTAAAVVSVSRKRPAPPPSSSLPKPTGPDYVDFFVPESEWPPPNTSGGLRRLVRIKQEKHAASSHPHRPSSSSLPLSLSRTTAATSTATSAASSSEEYYDDHPRDARETNLLGQLRTMGFTDAREMLAGLRHVMKDGGGSGSSGGGNIGSSTACVLDAGTILEGAMMWIISQREEAEEARKMDLVRILAENEQVEEERRRRGLDEGRLEEAPIEDIVGVGGNGGGGGEGSAKPSQAATPSKHKVGRSKYFHFSILLHSPMVRSVFLSISCPEAKKELVRLLRLEQKANQWYGSVLPWAYFTYVATGRIVKWANDESSSSGSGSEADAPNKGERGEKAQDVTSLIRNEANVLERALFALSEQHDNGLQNVPKIFIQARDRYAKKGLPDGPEGHATGDKSAASDDDDVVLVTGTATSSGASKKKSCSVDNDDGLDRKSAARPVASPNISSRSPHRNCASSERKKPAKTSSEVIEIM